MSDGEAIGAGVLLLLLLSKKQPPAPRPPAFNFNLAALGQQAAAWGGMAANALAGLAGGLNGSGNSAPTIWANQGEDPTANGSSGEADFNQAAGTLGGDFSL